MILERRRRGRLRQDIFNKEEYDKQKEIKKNHTVKRSSTILKILKPSYEY